MTTNSLYRSPETSIWQRLNWTWLHTFVLIQFLFQIMLLFPQIGVFRVPMRSASFGVSLIFLFLFPPKGKLHPAVIPVLLVLVIVLLGLGLNPLHNSPASAIGQFLMYLSILAPIFWVTSLALTMQGVETLVIMNWLFHSASAAMGALQTFFPGRFQPAISTVVQNSRYGPEQLLITLANGEQVYRPMGLTDTPGGAASAGLFAMIFGVVIALKSSNPFLKMVGAGSAALGLFCIYLSQVRSVLVMSVICLIFFAFTLFSSGQFGRLTIVISGVTAMFVAVFSWAVAVGGTMTLERITSLFSDKPQEVYQQNRGHFLQHTIENLLPQYPLGAGLGRWGMINNYFGDSTNLDSQPIWVEIQWTGWLLDGGVPLILAYSAAIAITCWVTYKIAINRQLGDFALYGSLIFGYNMGAIAVTFNYPLFISQGGMEFWILNTALFVAVRNFQFFNRSTN